MRKRAWGFDTTAIHEIFALKCIKSAAHLRSHTFCTYSDPCEISQFGEHHQLMLELQQFMKEAKQANVRSATKFLPPVPMVHRSSLTGGDTDLASELSWPANQPPGALPPGRPRPVLGAQLSAVLVAKLEVRLLAIFAI